MGGNCDECGKDQNWCTCECGCGCGELWLDCARADD